MKKIVVFSGAGMSAESGLKTFRDADGLWEEYDLNEVATPEAWDKNPELVLEFYNQRREQVVKAVPNDAHRSLTLLEEKYDVQIITQNIDDLHERAGSRNVLHLHGEILKAKSVANSTMLYDVNEPLRIGAVGNDGAQLRPHVVWFGESVPEYENAQRLIESAEVMIIVGTSLNVFPAAGLVFHAPNHCRCYLVDPGMIDNPGILQMTHVQKPATIGIQEIVANLLAEV